MNAFNTVNMAAACIVTSADHARTLGIPQDRWIYPLGAAGTSESAEGMFNDQQMLNALITS